MSPLYPWPTYRDPWQLLVETPLFDGVPHTPALETDSRRLRGDVVEVWETCAFQVMASAPADSPGPAPSAVHVLVSAPRVQLRHPVPLTQTDEHTWHGTVELPRDLLAGVATVVAEATALMDERMRLVGRSDTWSLVIDPGEAPVPAGAPPFPMAWVDFRDPAAPEPARHCADAPALMDLSGTPTLLLNEGVPGLHRLLHADTASGERRRARDIMGAEVARIALTTLVRAAAAEVATDDDAAPPADPLLRQSLEAVSAAMRTVTDAEDLARRIVDADAGPLAGRLAFWSEMDAAIARVAGLPDAQAALSEEARNA